MNILHIDSSILEENSVSKSLTKQIVSNLTKDNKDASVTHYDLDKNPINFLSSASFSDSKEQELGEKILKEFQDADTIVLGAPMYNFSVPAQVKAWIDRICVAGKTFRYTENGPEGLSGGKRIIITSTRGGVYSKDLSHLDHQESYLKTAFGFLGITDVEIIRAEGLNINPESKKEAVALAEKEISEIAA